MFARARLLAAAVFLGVFAFVLLAVRLRSLAGMDAWAEALAASVRSPRLTPLVAAVTDVGGFTVMAVATVAAVAVAMLARRPAYVLLFAVTMPAANLLVDLLKVLVRRPRLPSLGLIPVPRGFAFPSGHAAASSLFLGLLAVVAWRELRWLPARALALATCAAGVLAVSLSRVYLGVHRLTDVIASWALSGAWIALALAALAASDRRAAGGRGPDAA